MLKTFVILFLLSVVPVSAHADNFFTRLKDKAVSFKQNYLTLGHSYKNCSYDRERTFERLRPVVDDKLDELIGNINYHLKHTNFSSTVYNRKLKAAKFILKCSKLRHKYIRSTCMNYTHEKYAAQTLPIIMNTVKYYNGFWRLEDSNKVGMIIHELSHKCGTADGHFYPNKNAAPKSQGIFSWYTMGSTYESWASNGFCIPGYDCQY